METPVYIEAIQCSSPQEGSDLEVPIGHVLEVIDVSDDGMRFLAFDPVKNVEGFVPCVNFRECTETSISSRTRNAAPDNSIRETKERRERRERVKGKERVKGNERGAFGLVLYHFKAESECEMDASAGDYVYVLDTTTDPDWLGCKPFRPRGHGTDEVKYLPTSYVTVHVDDDLAKVLEKSYVDNTKKKVPRIEKYEEVNDQWVFCISIHNRTVKRTFQDFYRMHAKLCKRFPSTSDPSTTVPKMPNMPVLITQPEAAYLRLEFDVYLYHLYQLDPTISQCDILQWFLEIDRKPRVPTPSSAFSSISEPLHHLTKPPLLIDTSLPVSRPLSSYSPSKSPRTLHNRRRMDYGPPSPRVLKGPSSAGSKRYAGVLDSVPSPLSPHCDNILDRVPSPMSPALSVEKVTSSSSVSVSVSPVSAVSTAGNDENGTGGKGRKRLVLYVGHEKMMVNVRDTITFREFKRKVYSHFGTKLMGTTIRFAYCDEDCDWINVTSDDEFRLGLEQLSPMFRIQ